MRILPVRFVYEVRVLNGFYQDEWDTKGDIEQALIKFKKWFDLWRNLWNIRKQQWSDEGWTHLHEDSQMVLSSQKGRVFPYLEHSVLLWQDHHWRDRHSEVPNILSHTGSGVLQVGSQEAWVILGFAFPVNWILETASII